MGKENIKRARTCVYNCNYHIVFSTKYRRKVLTAEVEEYMKELLKEIAKEKGFEIGIVEVVEQDHVHIFVSAHPKITPSYIVKMIKGITARKLLLKFPQLKEKLWKGHKSTTVNLWNSSYYIETIGSINEDVIKEYIENQRKL